MMKSLNAFVKKLTWQLDELTQAQFAIEQQLADTAHQIDACARSMQSSRTKAGVIIPEQEIAHGYFLQQKQWELDQLQQNKSALLIQKDNLNQEQVRLKIDLKRLDKHKDKTLKNETHRALTTHFKNMDEWVLQQSTRS